MKQKLTQGNRSFQVEKQNDPYDSSQFLLPMGEAHWFVLNSDQIRVENGQIITLDSLELVEAYHDPATGASDFGAIVVAGRDRNGYVYILDTFVEKCGIHQQVVAALRLCKQWQVSKLYFEDNGFQELMEPTYKEEMRRQYFTGLQLEGETHSSNKQERIASLEIPIRNGHLLFNRSLSQEFIDQLTLFPTVHDDGPDALQGVYAKLAKHLTQRVVSTGVSFTSPTTRRNPRLGRR